MSTTANREIYPDPTPLRSESGAAPPRVRGGSPRALVRDLRSKMILLALDAAGGVLVAYGASTMLSGISGLNSVVLCVTLPLAAYVAGLYREYLPAEGALLGEQLFLVSVCLTAAVSVAHLVTGGDQASAFATVLQAAAMIAALPVWRLVARSVGGRRSKRQPVVVLGPASAANEASDAVRMNASLELVATYTSVPALMDDLGRIGRLAAPLCIIASKRGMRAVEASDLAQLRRRGLETASLAAFVEMTEERVPVTGHAVDDVEGWFDFSAGRERESGRVKRLLDLAGALALSIALGPAALLGGVAMCATSRGPLLLRQRRVGNGGHTFEILKLRSMRADAEAQTGAVWSSVNDPRITAVGRFLRRTRLDEVPQLWNVIIGEMSLVGPRPERPEFTEKLVRQIPLYDVRHCVPPGLTGWAQVKYPYGSSVKDSERKLEYDLYYIKNRSIWLDLRILLRTVSVVLFAKGGR